jgi:hypothetical protein
MKKFLTLGLVALTGLSLSACMNRGTDLPPGEYKKTTKSTDSSGTNYERNTTTNVEVDQYGNKRATTETETTKDPKGLMNKSTTTQKSTVYN